MERLSPRLEIKIGGDPTKSPTCIPKSRSSSIAIFYYLIFLCANLVMQKSRRSSGIQATESPGDQIWSICPECKFGQVSFKEPGIVLRDLETQMAGGSRRLEGYGCLR